MRAGGWWSGVVLFLGWSAPSWAAEPPSPSQQALYDALLPRHVSSDCAALDTLSSNPVADLRYVIATAVTPAWVPMRAAQCLVQRHASEAEAEIGAWLVDPSRKGLAIVAIDGFDALPAPLAERFAAKAVAGPLGSDLRPRLLQSTHASVRAVAQ